MRKPKQKHAFHIFTGASLSPYRLWATNAGNAMARFFRETGATNFGSDEDGGWKGYSVSLAN